MVHLWLVDVDNPILDKYLFSLSSDEFIRGEAYKQKIHGSRFRRCRSMLRVILGDRLGLPPSEIQLEMGEFGKPELRNRALYFNVSHSDSLALIVVSENSVGVDIERIKPIYAELDDLAGMVFSPAESDFSASMNLYERHDFFYKTWATKESYCKAIGAGLSIPLTSINTHDVSPCLTSVKADSRHEILPVVSAQVPSGFIARICGPSSGEIIYHDAVAAIISGRFNGPCCISLT